MKSVRRLKLVHFYQLGFTLSGIVALTGLLAGIWNAQVAIGITFLVGMAAGYGIQKLVSTNSPTRQSAKRRPPASTKYVPKDGLGKKKTQRPSASPPSSTDLNFRRLEQGISSLPGQLLTLFVLTSLAFFVYLDLGGMQALTGGAIQSQDAFFCGANIVGVNPDQVDSADLSKYEYELVADTCRDFQDYVLELSQGSGTSEEDMRKEVCDQTQEAMMSSMRKIQHFDDIQFLITGDVDNLRAYNMDVYTENCSNP